MNERIDFYKKGAEERLLGIGIDSASASRIALSLGELEKKAGLDVPDYISNYFTDEDGSIRWNNILIPSALMALTGMLTYKAGINGKPTRSFGENFMDYTVGGLRNLVRKTLPRSMYGSTSKYINHETPA